MNPTPLAIPLISPERLSERAEIRVRAQEGSSDNLAVDRPVWEFGSHCAELDGVRGIAIFLVTLYRFIKEWDPSAHWLFGAAKRYCEFGERGVDLFFVLSGFLITGILLQTRSSPGYFKNFIVRRALRIFPLYFAALVVCLFILPQVLASNAFDLPRSHQGFLWTYTSNIYMAWTNSWCFGPLDHFWSLAVEEHFYLIWPAIVFCLTPKALLRFSVIAIVIVGIVRTSFSMLPEAALAIDTLSLFRCDALLLGAILAVSMKQGLRADRVDRFAKWVLPALILGSLAVALSGKRWLGIPHTLFGCLWVALLAVAVTRARSHWMSVLLRAKWLQWLGRYSYGMYVIQLPLVSLLPMTLVASHASWMERFPVVLGLAYVVALFAMTSAMAFASYHLLEKRFLDLKRFFT